MNSGDTPPPPPPVNLLPRRELQLQGPRPSSLRVSRDSHKIKKTPAPPPPPPQSSAKPPESDQAARDPVIIYSISPKIIHVETANFMDLVQRLTGPDTPPAAKSDAGLHSPAKLTAIHRMIVNPGADRPVDFTAAGVDVLDDLGIDGGPQLDRSISIPGILSPVPASLPPVSPAFFSPSFLDSSFLNFLHDLSPAAFQVGRTSPGGAASGGGCVFLNSPVNFLSPSIVPSPGAAAWDLFNFFQDF
ncbi:Protein MKS1 [Platanthera zijinensis]|uniref:Protein MKS1 n=1 Tax=Platanthera zijinensis TaxID=2320716 RepID=A0AAP0G2X9_9ASPA